MREKGCYRYKLCYVDLLLAYYRNIISSIRFLLSVTLGVKQRRTSCEVCTFRLVTFRYWVNTLDLYNPLAGFAL